MAHRSSGSSSRIYVGNLPSHVRNADVEDIFDKYGRITECDLKLPRSGDGPAFAFIQFDDPRDAQDAIRGRDGYRIAGQKIRVQHPQPRGSNPFSDGGGRRSSGRGGRGRGGGGPPRRSDYRLMVSGLPPSGSWQDIKDHMREAGEVIYADVFRDGTGVVEFSRQDDMEWAAKNLHDSKFKSHEGESAHIKIKVDGGKTRLRTKSPKSPRRESPRRESPRRRSPSRSRSRSSSSSRSSHSRSRSPRR